MTNNFDVKAGLRLVLNNIESVYSSRPKVSRIYDFTLTRDVSRGTRHDPRKVLESRFNDKK